MLLALTFPAACIYNGIQPDEFQSEVAAQVDAAIQARIDAGDLVATGDCVTREQLDSGMASTGAAAEQYADDNDDVGASQDQLDDLENRVSTIEDDYLPHLLVFHRLYSADPSDSPAQTYDLSGLYGSMAGAPAYAGRNFIVSAQMHGDSPLGVVGMWAVALTGEDAITTTRLQYATDGNPDHDPGVLISRPSTDMLLFDGNGNGAIKNIDIAMLPEF